MDLATGPSDFPPGARVITHRATLDISANLLTMTIGAVARPRRRDRRPWQRATGVHRQALLVLRFLRDATPLWRLARDIGASTATATGYRYLHQALPALAKLAPTRESSEMVFLGLLELSAVFIVPPRPVSTVCS